MCKHTEDSHTKGNTSMTEKKTSPQNRHFCITLSGRTHPLVHAHLSSCGCSRSTCANTCLQMHLLCPHLKSWAKWPRHYLPWKTLENTVRCTQLKRFPFRKRAETRSAEHRASEALRGSWRVQEVAMFSLRTLPLCPPPAACSGAFKQPESFTRDGLFLSI